MSKRTLIMVTAVLLALAVGYGYGRIEGMERTSWVRDSLQVDRMMERVQQTGERVDSMTRIFRTHACYYKGEGFEAPIKEN